MGFEPVSVKYAMSANTSLLCSTSNLTSFSIIQQDILATTLRKEYEMFNLVPVDM